MDAGGVPVYAGKRLYMRARLPLDVLRGPSQHVEEYA
jgi:hypothetical protein